MNDPMHKQFDELYAKRFKLWSKLVNVKDFARGSVVILRRPCTYKACGPCRRGDRHPAVYLSVKKNGKTQLIYLPKTLQEKARDWIGNYRQLQTIVEEVSDANHQILRILAKKPKKMNKGGT
jgi:hypothetical protein